MKPLSPKIKKALSYEEARKLLLEQGDFDAALRTYSAQKEFLPDENTGDFWDKHFANDGTMFPMEKWRNEKVVDLLDCNKSILSLGAGRGVLEEVLVKKCSSPNYLGTDITRKTITELEKKFPTLKFEKTDLVGLSPQKHQFDQILLLEVLEHIKPNETFAVLKQVHALLKPDGKFFISVPVNEGLDEMLPTNPNSHMRLYSEELLKFELKTVGFKVETVYRASAFASNFGIKHFLNSLLKMKEPNNLLMVCTN